MEKMELELNLAEADAKLKVLENFKSVSQTKPALIQPQSQSDGMNDYLKYYQGKYDESVDSELYLLLSLLRLEPFPKHHCKGS